EVYTSLKTHLVEGVASAITLVEAGKWSEAIRYISMTNHVWYGSRIVASGDFWKTLPEDLKGIIERNTQKYAQISSKDVTDGESGVRRRLEAMGIAFN